MPDTEREDQPPTRSDTESREPRGARWTADEGEPDIEPFAPDEGPAVENPEHGYGYE